MTLDTLAGFTEENTGESCAVSSWVVPGIELGTVDAVPKSSSKVLVSTSKDAGSVLLPSERESCSGGISMKVRPSCLM